MYIISYLKDLVKYVQQKSLRLYLLSASMVLVIFAIWFSNSNLLPFAKIADFLIFVSLAFLLALYRPGWTFLFFVASLPLENINLMPQDFGFSLRPYQLFGFLTVFAFTILSLRKRITFSMPKFFSADAAVLIFVAAGFISSIFALDKSISFKQSLIIATFVALYFLTRIYVQNLSDLKRIYPFIIGPSIVIVGYSIWQNLRFSRLMNPFESMPGRPNGTFAEPDWLGIYLVFLIAVILSVLYAYFRNIKFSNSESLESSDKLKRFFAFAYLTLVFSVLIICMARSAWLGAMVVLVAFLKLVAYNGLWNFSRWKWRKAGLALLGVSMSAFFGFAFVKMLNLTAFEIFHRAQSTATGLQEITVSCDSIDSQIPSVIEDTSRLIDLNCRQINLEEIDSEKQAGRFVTTTSRPDPTRNIRSKIYKTSFATIKKNLFFGVGWGGIGEILGRDENGMVLNSSNVFLEIWLGSGMLGLFSFIFILFYVLINAMYLFVRKIESRGASAYVILGMVAIVVPNLFNAGIFLGFVWVYLGMAVSLVSDNKKNI